ncbi:AMP-binding protein [Pusillimonas sp. TS35]|uniref:AMP-binding protein n=1 Tax=Paracandidimonas lactea TaxID=2895524 RepID=UPI001367CD15|nr:AMP-binding protein [Paracandidimonas lactea]MYN13275.1 AMP-binding protein [Pusillimonas sp. TS35]
MASTQTLDFLQAFSNDHGEVIALRDDHTDVTYGELATAVRALAVAIQTKDPTPGSPVALCATPGLEYLLSVLAIQAAGKTLLPLDPQADTDTLHDLLNASVPAMLITDDNGQARINADDDYMILFSQFEGLVRTYRDRTLQAPEAPEAPALT